MLTELLSHSAEDTEHNSSESVRRLLDIHTARLTSKDMRSCEAFMRNSFEGTGKWGIPIIRKQSIDLDNVDLIAYSDTRILDSNPNLQKGVHFFVDDYRFSGIYNNPSRSFVKLQQYAFVLTPDFSTYAEMQPWRQIESVAHGRWCGALWQRCGLTVIPTMTWSTPSSLEYCNDGVEEGSIVAVGMVGCKQSKRAFMYGYDAMLDRVRPEAVICFGNPYPEMRGLIITIDYLASRKVVR